MNSSNIARVVSEKLTELGGRAEQRHNSKTSLKVWKDDELIEQHEMLLKS